MGPRLGHQVKSFHISTLKTTRNLSWPINDFWFDLAYVTVTWNKAEGWKTWKWTRSLFYITVTYANKGLNHTFTVKTDSKYLCWGILSVSQSKKESEGRWIIAELSQFQKWTSGGQMSIRNHFYACYLFLNKIAFITSEKIISAKMSGQNSKIKENTVKFLFIVFGRLSYSFSPRISYYFIWTCIKIAKNKISMLFLWQVLIRSTTLIQQKKIGANISV